MEKTIDNPLPPFSSVSVLVEPTGLAVCRLPLSSLDYMRIYALSFVWLFHFSLSAALTPSDPALANPLSHLSKLSSDSALTPGHLRRCCAYQAVCCCCCASQAIRHRCCTDQAVCRCCYANQAVCRRCCASHWQAVRHRRCVCPPSHTHPLDGVRPFSRIR